MRKRDNTCTLEALKQMTTQQLDQLLGEELAKETPDAEVVLPILHVLEQREKNITPEITPEIQQAWERFQSKTAQPEQSVRVRPWLAGIAAAVALVCLLVFMLPRSANAENILSRIFRWTQSIFEFSTPEQDATNPPVAYTFQTDNPGLQQLYDKMTELGVSDPVVPMWLPAGFEVQEFKTSELQDGQKVFLRLSNSNGDISFTYRINKTTAMLKYEKEDLTMEVIDIEGIDHIIVKNGNTLTVKWEVNNITCLMSADLAMEDIHQVIKSIYKRDLS